MTENDENNDSEANNEKGNLDSKDIELKLLKSREQLGQTLDKKQEITKEKKVSSDKKPTWKFCPACGGELLQVDRLRYCTECGLDLRYLKEHKMLPLVPAQNIPTYSQYPPQYQQYPQYYRPYKTPKIKIPEKDISNTKNLKLWSTLVSIGIPLLAFVVMNLLVIGLMILITVFIFDVNLLYDILTSSYFIIFASVLELVMIIFPIYYVRKYLERPNYKNRFELLGFTRKGYDNAGVLKEVLIGLGFAVIAIFLVVGASIAIELFLEYALGVRIVQSPTSDADALITPGDITSLILFVLVMLLIVGPAEEILFRGFQMKGLTRTLGDMWGLIITALIFALIHLITLIVYIFDPFTFFVLFLYMFVPYFAISILLGLLFRWRDENLIAVIITHGVYNSITLILAFLYVSGF